MTPIERVRQALSALAAHKLRTGLATLGVLFGVGAVIAMQSIGEGARREAEALLRRAGVTRVLVRALEHEGPDKGEEALERMRRSQGLRVADAEAVMAALPHVLAIGGRKEVEIEDFIPHPLDGGKAPPVVGVDRRTLSAGGVRVVEGRVFDAADEADGAAVCVLGQGARRRLFPSGLVVGKEVRLDGTWCRVVGVVAEGSGREADLPGLDLADRDAEVYLPLASAMGRFPPTDESDPEVDEVSLDLRAPEDVLGVAEVVDRMVLRLHGGVRDFEVVVPLKLLQQNEETQRLWRAVMALIAGISLLVGGIGIMNIMLSSVLERTREIGVRRALGATRGDVSRQFLMEAAAISVLGGLLGIGLGAGAARALAATTGWTTAVSARAVLASFGISVAVGLLSGWWPARRAAALEPMEALRHD